MFFSEGEFKWFLFFKKLVYSEDIEVYMVVLMDFIIEEGKRKVEGEIESCLGLMFSESLVVFFLDDKLSWREVGVGGKSLIENIFVFLGDRFIKFGI